MESERLIEKLNKYLRDGIAMSGVDTRLLIDSISSSIPILDMVLGGGFPRGMITELIGDYSSGKSLLALLAVSSAQKAGELACYIDAEKAFNPLWAQSLGVDLGQLIVARPNSGEEAFDVAEKMVKAEAGVSVVVLDSLAACIPTAEAEEEMGQQSMGQQAKLINKGLRKIVAANSSACMFLLNQLRETIGKTFGNPEVLPGGKGQGFAASIILRVRRGEWLIKGDRRIGHNLKLKTEKNRVAPPWQECEVPFYYKGLIDREDGLISLGLELGIMERSGAWYQYKDIRAQGREKMAIELRKNPKVVAKLRKEIEHG
jgi:recombination protein RecA